MLISSLDLIKSNLGSSILCQESALEIHRLGNSIEREVSCYLRCDSINNPLIRTYKNLNGLKDVEKINGFFVTSKERTLIELIQYHRDDGLICEALQDYLDKDGSESYLIEKSKEYDCEDKMKWWINSLDDYFTEV